MKLTVTFDVDYEQLSAFEALLTDFAIENTLAYEIEQEERHYAGCICADCSNAADLTSDND